jgi:hypothetical protein
MARYFITGIAGGTGGVFEVLGHLLDSESGQDITMSVVCPPISQNLATSARQQVQEQLVPSVNAQIAAMGIPLVLIASDIEWVC